MNTKQILLVLLVAVASAWAIMAPSPATGQDIPSSAMEANIGYKAVATQSITVTSATAVIMGTLPVGTHEVEAIASTVGDVNYGPSTVGTSTTWPYIAAGSQKTFSGITTRNPTIYFRPRGSVATTTTVGFVAK